MAVAHRLTSVDYATPGESRFNDCDKVHTLDSSRYLLASIFQQNMTPGLEPDNIDTHPINVSRRRRPPMSKYYHTMRRSYQDMVVGGGSTTHMPRLSVWGIFELLSGQSKKSALAGRGSTGWSFCPMGDPWIRPYPTICMGILAFTRGVTGAKKRPSGNSCCISQPIGISNRSRIDGRMRPKTTVKTRGTKEDPTNSKWEALPTAQHDALAGTSDSFHFGALGVVLYHFLHRTS